MTPPTKARPSIQDVARLAGVSLGTVSNVLNNPDKVKPQTLAKVTKAIDQLGFVRNDAARQLKAGRSQTIGLIVPDIANPFFSQLSQGAEDAADNEGYSVILGSNGHNPEREASYFNLFEEQRVSGILVTPLANITETLVALRNRGTQTVVVDRKLDTKLGCSVSMDDFAGGKLATQHLIDNGATKIAFVGGPLEYEQVAERLAGAKEVVRKTKGKVTLKHIKTRELTVLAGREIGLTLMDEPKETWPDAIFAANDLLAVGLLQAFVFKGKVKVPSDISLIGYDDIDFAEAAIVPLSSVRQPAVLLGATAVEMLIDESENPTTHIHRQITFQPELIVRESSVKK